MKPTEGHVAGRLMGAVDPARSHVDQQLQGVFHAEAGFSGGPVWAQDTGHVVGMLQSVGTRSGDSDVYVLTVDTLVRLWPEQLWQPPPCPYRGLRPFDRDSAGLFYGREATVAELIGLAKRLPLIPIVGPSGSGKSSLIEAGLLPAMQDREPSLSLVRTVPGSQPLRAVAARLLPSGAEHDALDRMVARIAGAGLRGVLRDVRLLANAEHIVLVIDQAEQIFTECRDPAERAAAIGKLGDLLDDPDTALTVVLAVREEYFGSFVGADERLGEYIKRNALVLRPMAEDELRAVISQPAREADPARPVEFEDGLVDQIYEDFSGRPGELPFLQFALTRLWEKQERGWLTFSAYRKIGGVTQALAQYADQEFDDLQLVEQNSARRIFTAMVLRGTVDVARRLRKSELRTNDWAVAVELQRRRLVVIGSDRAAGEEYIEIAHEALLRGWHRLREWIEDDRDFNDWQQATQSALDLWQREGEIRSLLLRGFALATAENMLALHPFDAANLRPFIAAGRAAEDVEEQERADLVSRLDALRLAAEADRVRVLSPAGLSTSLALSIASLRRFPTLEGDYAIRGALGLASLPISRHSCPAPVSAIAFSPDGLLVAAGTASGAAQVFDVVLDREVYRVEHAEPITALRFHPDRPWLATASGDGLVRLSDAASGTVLLEVDHPRAVRSVRFSSDGERLLSASDDGQVLVTALSGRPEPLRLTLGHAVASALFHPDGTAIAVVDALPSVRLLSAENGTQLEWRRLRSAARAAEYDPSGEVLAIAGTRGGVRMHTGKALRETRRYGSSYPVSGLSFSSTDPHIAIVTADGLVRVYNWAADQKTIEFRHGAAVTSLAWSADGSRLLTGSSDRTARVTDVSTGVEICRAVHPTSVDAVAFGVGSDQVATASSDGNVLVSEAVDGAQLWRVDPRADMQTVRFTPDGTGVFFGARNGYSRFCDVLTGAEITLSEAPRSVQAAEFSADGQLLAIDGGGGDTVRVYSIPDRRKVHDLDHDGPVNTVRFSPDSQLLLTGCEDGALRVFAADGTAVHRWPTAGPVYTCAWSPDGQRVAAGGGDVTVVVFDLGSGEELHRLAHDDRVWSVEFSPGGSQIATVSDDGYCRVFDVDAGVEIWSYRHEGTVTAIAYEPAGRFVATASADESVHVFDSTTGSELGQLAHDGAVRTVAFSADGSLIVTASDDRTARLFEVGSYAQLSQLTHGAPVTCARFSPDGSRVATGTSGRHEGVQSGMWAIQPAELIAQALSRLPRNLNEAEWKRYRLGEFRRLRADLP